MKQPLWIINAFLFVLMLFGQLLLFFLQQSVPRKASLTPDIVKEKQRTVVEQVDIKKIYGVNDLFGTYVPEVPVLVKEAEFKLPEIPQQPSSIPLTIPIEKPPVFIAPLGATLKGVVYLHDNQNKSMAIIQFDDSKVEQNYRVGELVRDAQILKIFPNRVIVVRSNGQQETLYLRTNDAQQDFAEEGPKGVDQIQVALKDGVYYLSLDSFINQVKSLGQFIDMLDLTTVYKQGASIGCRVGNALKGTLGFKLGFEADDVITKVDSLPVTDLHSRIEIYDHIVSKKLGSSIVVEVSRGGKSERLTYILSDQSDMPASSGSSKVEPKQLSMSPASLYSAEQEKKKILEQKVKLAPTAHQIQKGEQKKLLEARRKNMLSNKYNIKSS